MRPNTPVCIELEPGEATTGLSDRHLFEALDAFHQDGVVVLGNAIPVDIIDELNARMAQDTARIVQGGVKNIHWNQGEDKGNISQVPPMEGAYLYPEIYANRAAGKVLNNILGPKPELRYVRSNTLIGMTIGRQRVHKDLKEQALSHPCAVALNVCLVDATPQNGSTELWLGTHREVDMTNYEDPSTGHRYVREDVLDRRKVHRPPIYPLLKKGSLVLRDVRLWHAGMPNATAETRVMLALVYTAAWYKALLVPRWLESAKTTVEELGQQNGTVIAAQYVGEDRSDYLEWNFDGSIESSLE